MNDLQRTSAASVAKEQEEEELRRVAFRMRLASQQFLKHHGPLLRAYVRMGGSPENIAQRGVFEAKAREARTLAFALTAKVLGKPMAEVTMEEARNLRLEAAEIVAQAWEAGKDLDIGATAASIGAAVASADDAYDAETIEWSKTSGNGSATMTAAAITISLAASVNIYDFRNGRDLVLNTLTATVVEATRDAVNLMSPDQATVEDRRSLSQTTMRSFASIMSQIYEAKAREALAHLVNLDEPKRRAWLRAQAPLETVVREFRIWTADISQVAAAAARETISSAKSSGAAPQNR